MAKILNNRISTLPRDIRDIISVFLRSATVTTPHSYRSYFDGVPHGTWWESDGYAIEYVHGKRTERLEDVSTGHSHVVLYEQYPDSSPKCLSLANGNNGYIRRKWYANGTLRSRAVYRNGQLNGVFMSWRENGRPECRQEYVGGSANGLHEMWTPEGVYGGVFMNGVEQVSVGDILTLKNNENYR